MRRALYRLSAGQLHARRVTLLLLGLLSAPAMLLPASPLQTQTNAATGQALLQAGKPSEAREAFEATLSADPANADAQHGEVSASERLALDARSTGQMDEALRDLLRAQTFAPKDPRLLYDLGILEDEMQLFRDADATLATLEQLRPPGSDPQVLYAVARVKIDLGQLAAAEAKMLAYLKMQPADATAHYGLGRVYQLGFQFDKARAEFQHSIELQPVQTEAYYQLGDIALGQGAFDEAIAEFARTLTRDPKHGGALTGTGQVYFKQKRYNEAEEYLNRAVAAAPEYQAGHYYLGLTLARLGRQEASQRELDLATQLADVQSKRERGRSQFNPQTTNPQY